MSDMGLSTRVTREGAALGAVDESMLVPTVGAVPEVFWVALDAPAGVGPTAGVDIVQRVIRRYC